MLDINFIREKPEEVKKGIKEKGYDPKLVDRVLKIDQARRELIGEIEKWRQARNKLGREEVEKGKKIKEMLRRLEPDLRAVEEEFVSVLSQLPNLPADDVPVGKDESENIEVKKWGQPKKFAFKPKDHFELGESLDVIDVKRAAKVSGTRFGYLKNEAVQLEFALVQFALKTLIQEGFIPIIPPVMIKQEMMGGMGYFEHGGKEEMYLLEEMVLVGTSEQAVGPMHAGEVFEAKDLPRRYMAFSSCFRKEAGAYGKDTRGIFRVHQFDKVEMFSFIKPQEKDDLKENQYLVSLEEKLMQALKIPYQITQMCGGDLGHPAARKYDVNAWFPAQKKYRETHSCSTCTDYQARRLNIRYREGGETSFVHMLNGTFFSQRPILAILENCQQKDGSVLIPEVLQKYTGFKKISPKN